jgi:hypothetical protein
MCLRRSVDSKQVAETDKWPADECRDNSEQYESLSWQEALEQLEDAADEYFTDPQCRFFGNKVRARIAELEAAVPRWIPVSERLPDIDGHYLTFGVEDDGTPILEVIWFGLDCGRRQWGWRRSYLPSITHWAIPIPPSPAMEKSITPEADEAA